MGNRLKSTDEFLRSFKVFQKQFGGFITFMDDVATIDSLEKSATEAEAARDKAQADKAKIEAQSASLLDAAQKQADKLKADAEALASEIGERANSSMSSILDTANNNAKLFVSNAEKKAGEIVEGAAKEKEALATYIKQNTPKAKALEDRIKSLDNQIETKEAALKVIEDKLAELRSHLGG